MNKVTRIENGERVTDRGSEITDMLLSGALGLSVLRIWPIFGSVFALKNCGFLVLVSCAVCGFSSI